MGDEGGRGEEVQMENVTLKRFLPNRGLPSLVSQQLLSLIVAILSICDLRKCTKGIELICFSEDIENVYLYSYLLR